MAYQALYRKYRPNTFDDFIDQDTIKKILVNSIINKKISHAYLFSGSRGIGKTSMAKIFAKAINCLSFDENNDVCNKCTNCLEVNNNSVDIIEIDAASNNGVDQIRELKNKISIVPSNLKYKVYIIDEVHMLTNSAFNALLKTLEEPPSYVVFILATTEFYEVPETIVSRCQCYNFRRISIESLKKRLRYISDSENIDITDEAILEIAEYSNGGLRDAISMLDKMRSFTNDKITVDVFKNINGMISQEDIIDFYQNVFNKNLVSILDMINKIEEVGYDFKNFIERVMIFVRNKIVDYYIDKKDILGNIDENIQLISILNDIINRLKDSVNPMIIVQIYILKFVEKNNSNLDSKRENIENSFKNNNKENIAREIITDNDIKKKNIAREIITDNDTKKKNIAREINPNNTKNVNKDKSSSFVINEDIKRIRINNAMATANIKYKNELGEIWKKLDSYFVDDKYGKVAQLLSDTVPMVVGSENIILISSSEGITNNIYSNINLVEDFMVVIYHMLKIVIVSSNEFEKIKNQYIIDKKNNISYHIEEEYDKLICANNNLINQALNVFGSDMVDIE